MVEISLKSINRSRQGLSRLFRAVAFGFLVLLSCGASAASFTASLDRDTITLGESANLALTFSGLTSQDQATPTLPNIPNLQVAYIGPASEITMISGQFNATITHNYRLTARQPGDYTIPAASASVSGTQLSTQPVTLKVLKPNAVSPTAPAAAQQFAFLKLVLPKTEAYIGETIVAQIQVFLRQGVQSIHDFQFTSELADVSKGWLAGKSIEGQRSQTQIANTTFTIIPLVIPIKALRAGELNLGPITASVVVELPLSGGRRDPFDPFGMFGRRTEGRQVALATETVTLHALPLPEDSKPPGFNGAIGSFTMSASAGPTNLTAGDPITLKVQISGRGSLDSVTLPDQPGWLNFKTYPPTFKVDAVDALGLQGTKSFEQVIVPESAELKSVPPVSFSFFDPDQKQYRTLTHPAIPLTVRPAASSAMPTIASSRQSQEAPAPAQDIVPIKQRPGTLAIGNPLLLRQPWFLLLQVLPLVALVASVIWRRNTEALARNPRLRRQRHVSALVKTGLADLRRLASENNSELFFSTLFRLLQEQLGERLDVPASAITEAVVDERLRPAQVDPALTNSLQELFQACNLARYAPVRDSQELAGYVARTEQVLVQLREVRL